MPITQDLLKDYIVKLLHINEENSNNLVDLKSPQGGSTYILSAEGVTNTSQYVLNIITDRYGKPATTMLNNSTLGDSNIFGYNNNTLDWRHINGHTNVQELIAFKNTTQKDITAKGNNPLFLSIGAVEWRICLASRVYRTITSPLLIFPIRLIKTSETSPIALEFVADDIYLNPCFYHKLFEVYGDNTASRFPLPCGNTDIDQLIDLQKLNLAEYYQQIEDYIAECVGTQDNGTFALNKHLVAISVYRHSDMCMYYDLRRNRQLAMEHPLINRLLAPSDKMQPNPITTMPKLTLPYDSTQERIIARVVAGDSLQIKGPPGSGKTLTIANMIAALISQGKTVLFTSKKLSALSEVYNKMPQPLQNLVLRLDSESEAQASKINPTSIHRELSAVFNEQPDKRLDSSLTRERNQLQATLADDINQLKQYIDAMHQSDQHSSIYGYLDNYLSNINCPVLDFVEPVMAIATPTQVLDESKTVVDILDEYYKTITVNNSQPAHLCPWYGLEIDNSDIQAVYQQGKQLAKDVMQLVEDVADNELSYLVDNLTLSQLINCLDIKLDSNTIEQLLSNSKFHQAVVLLSESVKLYNDSHKLFDSCKALAPKLFEQSNLVDSMLPATMLVDNTLYIDVLDSVINNKHIFNNTNGLLSKYVNISTIKQSVDSYYNHLSDADKYLKDAQRVFGNSTINNSKNIRLFEQCYKILSAHEASYYDGSNRLKGIERRAIKKALALANNPEYTTEVALVDAVFNCMHYYQSTNNSLTVADSIQKMLCCKLTTDDIAIINYVITSSGSTTCGQLEEYYNNIFNNYTSICLAMTHANISNRHITIAQLEELYQTSNNYHHIAQLLDKCNQYLNTMGIDITMSNIDTVGNAIVSMHNIVKVMQDKGITKVDCAMYIDKLLQWLTAIDHKHHLSTLHQQLMQFFTTHFGASHYDDDNNLTISALSNLSMLTQLNIMQSCMEIDKILLQDRCKALVKPFFVNVLQQQFVNDNYNLTDVFLHSFYAKAILAIAVAVDTHNIKLSRIHIERLLESIATTENRLQQVNAQLIKQSVLNSIDRKDNQYNFLSSDRSIYRVCRLLFSEKASQILALKRCHILSPSTVSLLYRNPIYNNFDVLIADEASQMPPQQILPALMRAKQVVIVGDEHQMPPIVHFVRTSDSDNDNSGYEALTSVLDLTKRNASFDVEELKCHFRSKTESLIAFSQERYYPQMITFPAVVPRADDIGIVDILKEDGYCEDATNKVEADTVIEVLQQHFDRYYDDKTRTLSQSVGIVVFGEKQQTLIERKLADNKELSDKINLAIATSRTSPEKTFFIRTILTVQGQEIDHLILSFTYGKNKDGKYTSNFGDLNRNFGEQIFNVAVTRGKNKITAIHSFDASQLKNENLSFIKQYLDKAKQYSTDEVSHRFVSEPTNNSLVNVVKDYIISQGIDSKRIVTNYGVNKTSVRIPIAILSADLSKAVLGIWCETNIDNTNYIDKNIRYKNILSSRGWDIYTVFVYDWIYNTEYEQQQLLEQIKKVI